MWSRKFGMTVQLLNRAELFVSFCSVEMFWCLYRLRRQEPCLPLAFYWLREHYVAETSRLIVLVVSPLIHVALLKELRPQSRNSNNYGEH